MTAPWGLTWETIAKSRVIDLAHVWERGMPVSPNHPAFELAMMRRHGDMVRSDGGSAANEMFLMGGHVGTHIDAIGHVSQDGLMHGGVSAADSQSNHGLSALGIDMVEPIVCRGVLLDVAAVHDVAVLDAGYEVTADDLAAAQKASGAVVGKGDAVLIRTGWSVHWEDPVVFGGQAHGAPGPGDSAGRWLADRQVRVTGAETIAYEVIRPGAGHTTLPVHRILLVEFGIHIMEAMNLIELATAGTQEFLFVAAPLKLVGGTGSPIRPLAIIDG
ncbi:MAG: cyclase family protein [Acidimicrobiia bacterium]